jgi:HprK-related kinase A
VTLGQLPARECSRRLAQQAIVLRLGPFTARIGSPLGDVAGSVRRLYHDFHVAPDDEGARFALSIEQPGSLRRYLRPQVQLVFEDALGPFEPLPRRLAPALVEWGLNWCIGNHGHEFLVIHAAALERGGRVLMLPAPPGSGKSTLCVALATRGWRLLSDEFTLVDPANGDIVPVPRPMALKNGSIEIMQQWAPHLVFGPEVIGTEGTRIAYARPPRDAVARASERARPGWIVMPRYGAEQAPATWRIPRGRALVMLADNAFNHTMQGQRGFELLAAIAETAPACRITYPDVQSAVDLVERFCSASAGGR